MQLNQATDYSLRVVLFLTRSGQGEIVTAKTLSESEEIPMRYLLKIIRSLVKAGILHSHRGIEGGYSLAKAPENITILDVVEAIEGPIRINRCLEDKAYCSKHWCHSCPMHYSLYAIQTKLTDELKRYNFADLSQMGYRMQPWETIGGGRQNL